MFGVHSHRRHRRRDSRRSRFASARAWLSLSRGYAIPYSYSIRVRGTHQLSGETHRLGASPSSARIWRFMAYGTQPGHPRGLLLAWPRWEHLSHRMWPLTPIPGKPYNLVVTRIAPWRGKPVLLADGSEVVAGDMVGELHCNNEAILNLTMNKTISPYRAARADLRVVARWLLTDPLGMQVKAFFGLTLLATAAARLGFTVREHPVGIRGRLDRMFMTGLLVLYTRDGLHRLEHGTTLSSYPQEVWMPRSELLRRYHRPAEAVSSTSPAEESERPV